MEKLNVQIKVICLVSVLSGMLSAMIPAGKMKSAFTALCSVVLVSAMLTPLESFSLKDGFSFFKNGQAASQGLISETESAELLLFEKALGDAFEKLLKEKDIIVSVKPRCENVEGEIAVCDFTVIFSGDEEEKRQISELLSQSFKDTEVIFLIREDE